MRRSHDSTAGTPLRQLIQVKRSTCADSGAPPGGARPSPGFPSRWPRPALVASD